MKWWAFHAVLMSWCGTHEVVGFQGSFDELVRDA
jgi:hypothetical protein